jgi:hypothetical protein
LLLLLLLLLTQQLASSQASYGFCTRFVTTATNTCLLSVRSFCIMMCMPTCLEVGML